MFEFKNFMKMCLLVVTPSVILVYLYAILISALPIIIGKLTSIIIFIVTVFPFVFVEFKIIGWLSDKFKF